MSACSGGGGAAQQKDVPSERSEEGWSRGSGRVGRYTDEEDACLAAGLDKYWERRNKWEEIKRRAGDGLERRSEVSIARRAGAPAFLAKYAGRHWAPKAEAPASVAPPATTVDPEKRVERIAADVGNSTRGPEDSSRAKYETMLGRATQSLGSLEKCVAGPLSVQGRALTSPNPDTVSEVCCELIAPPCDEMWLEVAPSQCCALRNRLRDFFRKLLSHILLLETDSDEYIAKGSLRISERADAADVAQASLKLAHAVAWGFMQSGTTSCLVDWASVSLDVIRGWALLRDANRTGPWKVAHEEKREGGDSPPPRPLDAAAVQNEGLSYCALTISQCFSVLADISTASSDDSDPQFSQTYVLTLRSLVMKVHTVRNVLSMCNTGPGRLCHVKMMRAWLLTAWNAGLDALESTGDHGGAQDLRLQLALEGDSP